MGIYVKRVGDDILKKHSEEHAHEHHSHSHSNMEHKNIKVAFFLNLTFTIFEIFGGFYTNSLAIISDAIHDLGDTFSLGLAYFLEKKSNRKKNVDYTYGYKRYSTIGALINGIVLSFGSVFVIVNAIPRILYPEPVKGMEMMLFAIFGIIVNGAAVFSLGKGDNLNKKMVRLHLMEDLLGWIAVLITSIVLIFVDIPVIDSLLSIAIALFILKNSIINLKYVVSILLQKNLNKKDMKLIDEIITGSEIVSSYHNFKIWSINGEESICSFHIVFKDEYSHKNISELKKQIKTDLNEIKIIDVTIETECLCQDCECDYNQ